MLSKLRERIKPWINIIAIPFIKVRINPNIITFLGLLTGFTAALLFGFGNPRLAGIAILICGFFDIIDGAVARLSNKVTRSGGLIDSVTDRITDSMIFIGIMFGGHGSLWNHPVWFWPTIALVGSMLVSYTRARAEAAGTGKLAVGIAERAERLIILAIGGLLNMTSYAVVIVAILTIITVIHRLITAMNMLNQPIKIYK